jgi:hypothetical protein
VELGIPRCQVEDLKGGDAALNARILEVGAVQRLSWQWAETHAVQ